MPEDCVLTIGKFESIHRGHQALISEVTRLAKDRNLPSAVLTFEPHPNRVLGKKDYLGLFTSCERAYLIEKLKVDYLLLYPFDRTFAALSPQDFCVHLFKDLRVRVLVVGESYRFGHNRAGTVETLKQAAADQEIKLRVVSHKNFSQTQRHTPIYNNTKISTSEIRKLVTTRKMKEAAEWLGFPFFIMGKVERGNQIGRTLGYPTVNIRPGSCKLLPPDGVYQTRTIINGQIFPSVTNIGLRPTVSNGYESERTVEAFIIGFDGNLYGCEIITEFLLFLRDEKKFESIDALKEQIKRDLTQAR